MLAVVVSGRRDSLDSARASIDTNRSSLSLNDDASRRSSVDAIGRRSRLDAIGRQRPSIEVPSSDGAHGHVGRSQLAVPLSAPAQSVSITSPFARTTDSNGVPIPGKERSGAMSIPVSATAGAAAHTSAFSLHRMSSLFGSSAGGSVSTTWKGPTSTEFPALSPTRGSGGGMGRAGSMGMGRGLADFETLFHMDGKE